MHLQREAARDKLHADLVTVRVFFHTRILFSKLICDCRWEDRSCSAHQAVLLRFLLLFFDWFAFVFVSILIPVNQTGLGRGICVPWAAAEIRPVAGVISAVNCILSHFRKFFRSLATTWRNQNANAQQLRGNAAKHPLKIQTIKRVSWLLKCPRRWKLLVKSKTRFGNCKHRLIVELVAVFAYFWMNLQAIKRDEMAIVEEKERLESRRATVSAHFMQRWFWFTMSRSFENSNESEMKIDLGATKVLQLFYFFHRCNLPSILQVQSISYHVGALRVNESSWQGRLQRGLCISEKSFAFVTVVPRFIKRMT